MQGFAEDLSAWRFIHFIRLGPYADEYGKPWVYSVVCVSNDGQRALLLGFSAPDNPARPMEIARAAMQVARALGYTDVRWLRARPEGFHEVTANGIR